MASTGFKELRAPPKPSSNICVFGHGIVESFGRNFDTTLSKEEGLAFEFGDQMNGVHPLNDFAEKVTQMQPRLEHGDPIDIYHTGHARRVFWYPDLEIFKYIFWDQTGDISGNIQEVSMAESEIKAYWWKLWKFLTGQLDLLNTFSPQATTKTKHPIPPRAALSGPKPLTLAQLHL
eukprot:symbB.v1.2.040594.t1/scaffold7360.1/size11698/2